MSASPARPGARSREEGEPHRPRDGRVPRRQDARSAPAAATTRSPSASSRRSTRWASRRERVIKLSGHRLLEQEPGLLPRAVRTASTRSTGACRRWRPARCWRTRTLIAIGVSGDGDTGAIGIGQFVHLMRRNVPMIYIIEDNGCYGLTKGQFSPTADLGSTLKNGVVNDLPPIDMCALAIELGATFVARSFSGDKKQLLSLLKAAIAHRGTAMLDVISPVRDLQRPRGIDQELRLREGPRRAARGDQLRAVLRGHHGRLRAGDDAGSGAARRVEAVPEEAGRRLRPDRQADGATGPPRVGARAASSRPA